MMKTKEAEASREFWIFVKACIGIILVGVAVVALDRGRLFSGLGIILSGILMIAAALFGKEHYFHDERSRRIREKAGYNAYVATLITMFLLLAFGNAVPLIENANYNGIIMFIFFVGLLCFLIFSWHFNKKGD